MLQRQFLSYYQLQRDQPLRSGGTATQIIPRTSRSGVHARARRVYVCASSDADDIMAKYTSTAASGTSDKPAVRQQGEQTKQRQYTLQHMCGTDLHPFFGTVAVSQFLLQSIISPCAYLTDYQRQLTTV